MVWWWCVVVAQEAAENAEMVDEYMLVPTDQREEEREKMTASKVRGAAGGAVWSYRLCGIRRTCMHARTHAMVRYGAVQPAVHGRCRAVRSEVHALGQSRARR